MDSCRLRGMPSPSKPSSSECLGSLLDKVDCKPPARKDNINKSLEDFKTLQEEVHVSPRV